MAAEAKPKKLKLTDVRILILEYASAGYWGKGETWDKAYANAYKPKYYKAFLCHKDTYVDGVTPTMISPAGFDPVEFRENKPSTRRKARPK